MNRRQLLSSVASLGITIPSGVVAGAQNQRSLISKSKTDVTQGFERLGFGQMYYWTVGEGPILILVHQSNTSTEEFARLIPLLSHRYRLIAMDLPGHGYSDNPESEPTVDDYTIAVRELLDLLGVERAHVLGHHGGALTAMNLAASDPDRFDRLILSGIGGVRSPEESSDYLESLVKLTESTKIDGDTIAATWNRYVGYASSGARQEDILRPFMASLQSKLRPYSGLIVNVKWKKRAETMAKLRGPVLLVQGAEDQFVNGQEDLLQIIQNSSRVVMDDCGTFMFYDKAERCAAMISDYLAA